MGVILYRCLTGALPFYADTPTKLLMEIVQAEPKPVTERNPDVPKAFAEVVDRCLEEDLEKRWPSMEALLDALRGAADRSEIAFPRLPDADAMEEPETFDPGPRREDAPARPMGMKIAGAVLAAAVVAGGLYLATRPPEAVAETEAESDAVSETETAAADHGEEPEAGEGPRPEIQREGPAPTASAEAAETETDSETETAAQPPNPRPGRGMIRPSTMMETSMGAVDMRLPGVAEEW
jgi:serine/threonine-protein kinase